MLMLSLADIKGASSQSIPMISSTSLFTSSGLALGRSILLITGNISNPDPRLDIR